MKDIATEGRRLVVLGGGESGLGAAVLGLKKGMDVFLSDSGTLKPEYRSELIRREIPFEEGGHTPEKILSADIAVKSPGIPETAPLVMALREKGVPVVSEIEFAGYFTDSRMICITGSNGKTTTTLLTHHILSQAGVKAGLAGNVGHSLALQVAEDPSPIYVIELSSFQLDDMFDFKADVAVLLNITPDHLDRYGYKMENYAEAKYRITRNQTTSDHLIYWAEDPWTQRLVDAHGISAIPLPFAGAPLPGCAACLEEDTQTVVFKVPGAGDNASWSIHRSELSLPGLHNLYNSMAAALAAQAAGVTADIIKHSLRTFQAVAHRLEPVGSYGDVNWINDSKATNVNSTYYALESMDRPTVLILGGNDKGNDYSEILPFVKEKVKAIVCMGVDNRKIIDYFSPHVPRISDTHSLEDCVAECARMARPGDNVLLSPCCASFDLFKSYVDRGDRFRKAVADLIHKANSQQ